MISRVSRALSGQRGGGAFGLYFLIAFAFLAPRVLAHPERDVIGGLFTDPQIFIWSFAWWPHAIAHGISPIVTHAIWEPDGFNLAWATSVPGLALVFAPVTYIFGPVFAYNLASVLMPALSAWTAFLLCRRLTGSVWPSLAGGYLFGFSTYVLSAELTHIFSAAVFLVPVAALFVVRFVQDDLTGRGLAIRLALVLAGQMLLSTEVLFTLSLALLAGWVLAVLLIPRARQRLVALILPAIAAYAIAAVVTAPIVYYVFEGGRPPSGAEAFVADALNLVVPTMASLGGWWSKHLELHWAANDAERGTYLGVPLLVIVVLFAVQRIRTGTGRFLLAAFVLAVLCSFGSALYVNGHDVTQLPWVHLASRPLFRNLMPVRLMVFASLAAAVMTALWAARARPLWLAAGLPALAAIALLPNLSWGAWARTPQVPALFTSKLYESCIGRGENVLALPFGTRGDTMLWQARSGFWFRLAGGYISPYPPPGYTLTQGMFRVATEEIPPDVTTSAVLELVRLKHVTTIALDAREESLWGRVLRPFARPQRVGGVLLYRLRDAPPLATRCARAARAAA